MHDHTYVISAILLMGLVTFALRALPFVAARWLQKHPIVKRFGQFLPLAIMTLLLVLGQSWWRWPWCVRFSGARKMRCSAWSSALARMY